MSTDWSMTTDEEIQKAIVTVLSGREQIVIVARFPPDDTIEPLTLAEVAKLLGLSTRERVRQIQNIALSKLRRELQNEDRE